MLRSALWHNRCMEEGLRHPAGSDWQPEAVLEGSANWPLVFGTVLVGLVIAMVAGTHVAVALVVLPIVVAVAFVSPQSLVLIVVVWMLELGFIRRFVPGGNVSGISGDPLLILGPVMILALAMRAYSAGAFRNRTRLATVVMLLNLLAIFEAFNPSQGSIMTGFGGLLFMLVPVMAFWVGRAIVTPRIFDQVRWTVAIIALANALYGLSQQFMGFQSWDQRWINSQGYTALNLGNGVVRAFGSSSSAQEYAVTLAFGIIAWISLLPNVRRAARPLILVAVVPMALALYWESQRSALLLLVFGVGLVLGTQMRLRARWVALAGVATVALLVFGANAIGTGGPAQEGNAASTLSNHQISGIADPFGSKSSGTNHMNRTIKGLTEGVTNPLGTGTGSVTLAGSKFSTVSKGTEMDPGNMGIALGLPGEILYFSALLLAFALAYRRGSEGNPAGAFAVGILGAGLFQWFNGDLYGVCWLVWLTLGYIDQLPAAVEPEVVDLLAPAPRRVGVVQPWRP